MGAPLWLTVHKSQDMCKVDWDNLKDITLIHSCVNLAPLMAYLNITIVKKYMSANKVHTLNLQNYTQPSKYVNCNGFQIHVGLVDTWL